MRLADQLWRMLWQSEGREREKEGEKDKLQATGDKAVESNWE